MNGKIGLIALCAIVLAGLIFSQQGESLKSSTMSFETDTPSTIAVLAGDYTPITVSVSQDGKDLIGAQFEVNFDGPGWIAGNNARMSIGEAKVPRNLRSRFSLENGKLTFVVWTKKLLSDVGQVTIKSLDTGTTKTFKVIVFQAKDINPEWVEFPTEKIVGIKISILGENVGSEQGFDVVWGNIRSPLDNNGVFIKASQSEGEVSATIRWWRDLSDSPEWLKTYRHQVSW